MERYISSPLDLALKALREVRDPERRELREHNLNEIEYQFGILRSRELARVERLPAAPGEAAGSISERVAAVLKAIRET